MQYLLKKPPTKVYEEKKWRVEFPGHRNVKPAIEDARLCFVKISLSAAFLAHSAVHNLQTCLVLAMGPGNWTRTRQTARFAGFGYTHLCQSPVLCFRFFH